MVVRELLSWGRAELAPTDGAFAGKNARALLSFAAGIPVDRLLSHDELFLYDDVDRRYKALIQQAAQGKPLAYLLGEWDFMGMTLCVDERVLIPRDDTACVTELALSCLKQIPRPRVLDLCTGSGCIGLSIACARQDAEVTLSDLSEDALCVARANRKRLGLEHRVSIVPTNALQAPPPELFEFHLIVSNPPYVTLAEMDELPCSVRDFEPRMALCGGADGLEFYRTIAALYKKSLVSGGVLCFEFGMGQADAVAEIIRNEGFRILTVREDSAHILRAIAARYDGKEPHHGYKRKT